MAVAQVHWWRQPNRGTSIANDQRRDGHLESIEQIGFEEHRDGHAAALHEDARTAARVQQLEQPGRIDGALVIVYRDDSGASEVTFPGT
jgi:hypothetical protein